MKKKKTDYTLLWWVVIIVAIIIYSQFDNDYNGGSSDPVYPGSNNTESMEYQADMMEMDANAREYDPGDAYVPDPPDTYENYPIPTP